MRSPSEAPAFVRARPAIAGGSPEADEEDRAAGHEPGVPATREDTGAVVATDFNEPDDVLVSTRSRQPEVVFVAVACAVVTVALGIYPEPLFDVARDAGEAFTSLI
jgi:NADH-quinone oxidoreductase subunit N